MTGVEDLSYRRITESIAGKLDLLEAYLSTVWHYVRIATLWFQMSSKKL